METGIYCIVCYPSGKLYIGSASKFATRWSVHKHGLRRNIHPNAKLQNAWNKYGEEAFIFTVLELCEKDQLVKTEQQWFDSLHPELNIAPFSVSPSLGRKNSPESILKMRTAALKRDQSVYKGLPQSESKRQKLSQSMKGNTNGKGHKFVCSEATREKMRVAKLGTSNARGHKLSPESIAKMVETKRLKRLALAS